MSGDLHSHRYRKQDLSHPMNLEFAQRARVDFDFSSPIGRLEKRALAVGQAATQALSGLGPASKSTASTSMLPPLPAALYRSPPCFSPMPINPRSVPTCAPAPRRNPRQRSECTHRAPNKWRHHIPRCHRRHLSTWRCVRGGEQKRAHGEDDACMCICPTRLPQVSTPSMHGARDLHFRTERLDWNRKAP
ncbi:hypothetical protein BD309DRAFT_498719 [Dichomitus squalens]|uniref:Uncharacterized protein n=1 Tax=Dichomitus squalens TaxID=114155 RepID=A0A4Q9P8U1_9APHY|nr:hypothetical protein BD309DRAFT_498719 [Dichomitus squalens]TBU65392.1 hypothetical protein BD310DRAFT_6547 [Dichomitus squalens]